MNNAHLAHQPVGPGFLNLAGACNGKLLPVDMNGTIVQAQNIIFVNGSPMHGLKSVIHVPALMGQEGHNFIRLNSFKK